MVANLGNLMPIEQVNSNRTREQHSADSRKAGIASGKARREKATMKKTLEMLLEETNKNGQTYRELATLGLIKGAISGDSRNYKVMLETLGELKDNNQENSNDGILKELIEAMNNAKKN